MTIADVKAKNRAVGDHFFDANTMKFFGSRIESSLYKNNTFITSEYTGFERKNRAYTVRVFDEATGRVNTAKLADGTSTFNYFRTKEDAHEFCKNYQG